VYSDRFIPSRAVSARLQGDTLLDRAEALHDSMRTPEESCSAYTQLLRSELLGLPSPDRSMGIGCR
jgi:hypothetical protein